MVVAAVGECLGLYALGRMGTGTGTDYYLGLPLSEGDDDEDLNLEASHRLEVSGIDVCPDDATLWARVRRKVSQAKRGSSDLPALAGVIAFNRLHIVLQWI